MSKTPDEIMKTRLLEAIKKQRPGKSEESYLKDMRELDTDPEGITVKETILRCMNEYADQRVSEALNSQWVSVKERLPEHYGDFYTINKSGFQHVVYFASGGWLRKDKRDTLDHREITHWAPLLPSPPLNH